MTSCDAVSRRDLDESDNLIPSIHVRHLSPIKKKHLWQTKSQTDKILKTAADKIPLKHTSIDTI